MHVNALGALSPALPPQLPSHRHPPPACAYTHIASLMCSTSCQMVVGLVSTKPTDVKVPELAPESD
jgi:hypothetical protein